jgi:GT2 family glycosyltransferase
MLSASDTGVADKDANPPMPGFFATVIICSHTERRWLRLAAAIASVQRQRRPPDEVVLVIDHNEDLLERARSAFPDVRVIANEALPGLSGARNTGVRHSRGRVLAFLDDDAEADAGWLEALLAVFEDPSVIGAGGVAKPEWEGEAPSWLPPEFLWVVGATYTGLPVDLAPIRNPIGANMAFRREAFELAGGFSHTVGRLGHLPRGCEETEFAIRVRHAAPASVILHVPEARVDHHITADRARWRYFAARCWAEGASKAMVSSSVGSEDALKTERSYVRAVLPRGVLASLSSAVHGDAAGLARASVIVAGLALTTASYLYARVFKVRTEDDRRAVGQRPRS